MTKWLILDMHFLAWRSYHTTGGLKYGDVATGVLYGVFRDLITFTDLHDTSNVVFAFDRKPYLRKKVLKTYKDRPVFDPSDQRSFDQVREQIQLLRTKYLKDFGYRNVYSQKGYEADDIIASFVRGSLGKKDQAVVVSADHDLLQLLQDNVVVWNPNSKKATTVESFVKKYGVTPEQWPDVKALAGCLSDNVRGVQGVGEVRACQYVNGTLKPGCAAHRSISLAQDVIDQNLQLVKLPFPGTMDLVPKKDRVSKVAWKTVLKKLGMASMIDRYPVGAK